MGQQAMGLSTPIAPGQGSEPAATKADLISTSGAVEHPTVLALPSPPTLALVNYGPLVRPGALDEAYLALGHLRADLQDADRCFMRERLGLISGWAQVNSAIEKAWSQAEAANTKSRKEAADTRASHDMAQAEAAYTAKSCREAEESLKALQEEQAAAMSWLRQQEEASRPVRRSSPIEMPSWPRWPPTKRRSTTAWPN